MTKQNKKAKEEFKKSAKKPAAKMTPKKDKAPKKPASKKTEEKKEAPIVFPIRRGGGCWGTGRGGMGW